MSVKIILCHLRFYAAEIVLGLLHLHQRGIIYRYINVSFCLQKFLLFHFKETLKQCTKYCRLNQRTVRHLGLIFNLLKIVLVTSQQG